MKEYTGETSIVIESSPQKIYEYLLDFTRHPEWVANVSKIDKVSTGPIGVGTEFKTAEGPPPVPFFTKLKMMSGFMAGVMGGAKTYSMAKITALENGKRIAWQAGIPKDNGYFNFVEWEFVLEPRGAGTRLIQKFHWKPQYPAAERMVGAAGSEGLQHAVAVSLTKLKQRLETSVNGRA